MKYISFQKNLLFLLRKIDTFFSLLYFKISLILLYYFPFTQYSLFTNKITYLILY